MTHLRILSTLLLTSFLMLPAFGQDESKKTYDRDKDVEGLLELRQDTIDREDVTKSKRKEAGLENR